MKIKADGRRKQLNEYMFAGDASPVLLEVGTEQVRQVLRASLAAATYAERGARVRELIYALYRKGRCSVKLVIGSQGFKPILNSARRAPAGALAIRQPSVFKAIRFLHGMSLFEKAIENKTLNCTRTYATEILLG